MDQQLTLREFTKTFRISNAVTEGSYDYSICQLDIIFFLLEKIKNSDPNDKIYSVYVDDINKRLPEGRMLNYLQLSQSADGIMHKPFYVRTERGFKAVAAFTTCEYISGGAHIEISISEQAREYFFDIKNRFTRVELDSILKCTSKFSKRIYVMCCQWRKTGKFVVSISDLKTELYLKSPDPKKKKFKEQFINFGSFRESVLEVAKKQINEFTDIKIDYKLIKTGRAFTHIEFKLKNKEFLLPELEFEITPDTAPIEQMKATADIYKISDTVIKHILKTKKVEEFNKVITELELKFKNGEIKPKKNVAGYVVNTLRDRGLFPQKKSKLID